jgi:hypothetical protein
MNSRLLVCVSIGFHKVVKTFVPYPSPMHVLYCCLSKPRYVLLQNALGAVPELEMTIKELKTELKAAQVSSACTLHACSQAFRCLCGYEQVCSHTQILFFILALCWHEVLLLLLLPLLLGAHATDDRIAYSRGVSAQGHLAAGKQDSIK